MYYIWKTLPFLVYLQRLILLCQFHHGCLRIFNFSVQLRNFLFLFFYRLITSYTPKGERWLELTMHSVHPLYPYISIHIFLIVLYIFTKELTRRTCLTITSHTLKEKQSVELKMWDQYQYLGNCPPTPPLTQQQSIDNKLGLMLG